VKSLTDCHELPHPTQSGHLNRGVVDFFAEHRREFGAQLSDPSPERQRIDVAFNKPLSRTAPSEKRLLSAGSCVDTSELQYPTVG
jgi:hypothetical protein